MPDPTYSIAIEMSPGSFTEVGSDCIKFTCSRARADMFTALGAGRAMALLDNNDGRYSPEQPFLTRVDSVDWAYYVNTSYVAEGYSATNPYYGFLKPGLAISFQATHTGSTNDLFYGRLRGIFVDPALGVRNMTLDCYDLLADVARRRASVPVMFNASVSSIVAVVLSNAGIAAEDAQIDLITDRTTYYWADDAPVMQLLSETLPIGNYYSHVDGAGVLHFSNRYFGVGNQSVASYSNEFMQFNYEMTDRQIINDVRVVGNPRYTYSGVQTVAWISGLQQVAPQSTFSFQLAYVNPDNPSEIGFPCNSLITPVASIDYVFETNYYGHGIDQTFVVSVAATFYATYAVFSCYNPSSFTCFFTRFRIRGSALPPLPALTAHAANEASQDTYEVRQHTIDSNFIDDNDFAQRYANYLIERWSGPIGVVNLSVKNRFPEVLRTDIGHAITVIESLTATGSFFTVKELTHDVSFERGAEHTVSYRIERPTYGDFLVLDADYAGRLDVRRLAPF